MKTKKMVWISILIIVLCFASSTAVSVHSLKLVVNSNEENYARTVAANVYDVINSELSKPIVVGQTMSHNLFLLSLIEKESNYTEDELEDIIVTYLSDVAENESYHTAFVIFDESKKYYTQNGFNKIVDPINDEHDIWYASFLEQNNEYDFDIDIDEANNDSWTVFVNNRITDKDGKLIGVCGVGVIMTEMQDVIIELQNKYGVKINLVNEAGVVQVDVDNIRIENAVIDKLNLSEGNEEYQFNLGNDGYVVSRYMDNLGLYLVVQKDKEDSNETFSDLILKNLLTVLILLIILTICISIMINKCNRDIAIEAKLQSLSGLADIYTSMHLIDLKKNTITEIKSNEYIDCFIDKKNQTASEQIRKAMTGMTTEEYLDDILAFTEITTLADRMRGMRTISVEFIGKQSGYCRARFIAEGEDLDNIEHVIYAVEIIDKEKRREKELIALSETDRMTGLRNRTSGEKQISEYLMQKKQGMLLLLDVDDFKSFNDNYGHDIGDKVIVSIAECIKNTFRDQDVVMRLGGDEYMIYMLGVQDNETGAQAVERLFLNVKKMKLEELGDKVITISVGASLYNGEKRTSFQELYKIADTMMYESKKQEGNYCTFG